MTTDRYFMCETLGMKKGDPVYCYWMALIESGLIRHRLPEDADPGIEDIHFMLGASGTQCYGVFDKASGDMVGEAMLTNFQGRSAMLHFSFHPSKFGSEALEISKFAERELFKCRYPDGSTLRTLIGLTPATNRLAIRFLQKAGFTIKTTLTDAFILGNDGDRIVDGVLSQLRFDEV